MVNRFKPFSLIARLLSSFNQHMSFCADYQKELEITQGKLEAANVDFQSRAVEYARLLDLRASKIKKLETQLKVFCLIIDLQRGRFCVAS